MSNFNAPQTALPLPFNSTAQIGVDSQLSNGQSPQQGALPLNYIDAETVYSIAYASTITPDRSQGRRQTITLTGNVTINAPANAYQGQSIDLEIIQNTAGSHTATWGSAYKFVGGSKTLSTTGGRIDVASGWYDGTNWLMSLSKAYA